VQLTFSPAPESLFFDETSSLFSFYPVYAFPIDGTLCSLHFGGLFVPFFVTKFPPPTPFLSPADPRGLLLFSLRRHAFLFVGSFQNPPTSSLLVCFLSSFVLKSFFFLPKIGDESSIPAGSDFFPISRLFWSPVLPPPDLLRLDVRIVFTHSCYTEPFFPLSPFASKKKSCSPSQRWLPNPFHYS